MFSDLETLVLIYAASVVDAEDRQAHARAVVQELCLDPRLEALVPLRPTGRSKRDTYDAVLAMLVEITSLPEPERTAAIQQLVEDVAAARG